MTDETYKRDMSEIVARMEQTKKRDPFGFEWHEYAAFVPFEDIKKHLKEGADITEEQWESDRHDPYPDFIRQKLIDYMPFAWDKANNRRGISSSRSIMHMIAWTWLIGDDRLTAALEHAMYGDHNRLDLKAIPYCYYGKPQLVMVCDHYGIDWRALDDDEWTNHESEVGTTADRALSDLEYQ